MPRHGHGDFRQFFEEVATNKPRNKSYGSIFDYDTQYIPFEEVVR